MNKIGKRLSEFIDDLPDHLKKDVEKNFGRDELAEKICRVLDEKLDGVGTIDEILIAVVKFENAGRDIQSRRYLVNKLYRMATDGILVQYHDENGTRKKGAYKLPSNKSENQETSSAETKPLDEEGGGNRDGCV